MELRDSVDDVETYEIQRDPQHSDGWGQHGVRQPLEEPLEQGQCEKQRPWRQSLPPAQRWRRSVALTNCNILAATSERL